MLSAIPGFEQSPGGRRGGEGNSPFCRLICGQSRPNDRYVYIYKWYICVETGKAGGGGRALYTLVVRQA